MKALVTADIDHRIEKEFPNIKFDYFGYALEEHIPSQHYELIEKIQDYDFLICEFDTIDKDVIDHGDKLKMIICCRGGVHSVVDVAYATKKGIVVKNTPGRNASSVAEYVIGVIINADRKLYYANELVLSDQLQVQKFIMPEAYKDSLWGMDINSPYHSLRGKGLHTITLGIIGYGNVGRVVVNMAVLLGIHVLIYNHHSILSPVPAGAEIVGFDELLERSDYISLHCTNREHKVIIGKKELNKMKSDAYFINTARGDLVDEAALINALDNNKIKGAALDVTMHEPLLPNDPLIKAKNIFLTPHIAGAANEVIENGTDMAIYHLREYLSDTMEKI